MNHPVMIEVTRGGVVESRHVGAAAVLGAERDVRHVQRFGQLFELVVHTAAGHALCHFLK